MPHRGYPQTGGLLISGPRMRFDKPPKTVDEQIELLRSRGMVIHDHERARHYLTHINYYRLTAYWLPFEADHSRHTFEPGTTFDQVLNLYVFDREFRLLLLDAIERVEVSVRTQWAYYMAHQYGPHGYLDPNYAVRADWHERNLASLRNEVQRSDEDFIRHYRRTYTDPELPPVWSACEVMSLGLLSRWIKQLRKSDRARVAAVYRLDEQVFAAFIEHLTYVRNLCAHHSRVWNRRMIKTMQLPRSKPAELPPNINYSEQRRIYNTLVLLKYLLDIVSPRHSWDERLFGLIQEHDIQPTNMGFPDDYAFRPIWAG